MDEILRRLDEATGQRGGPEIVQMGRLYSEKEARAALDEHIKMAEDLAAVSGKDVKIWRVDYLSCIGFVELCVDDMTLNQILFDRRQHDMWRPYAGGGVLQRVDLDALTKSIRQVYAGGPEEWAKDPNFRPYRLGGLQGSILLAIRRGTTVNKERNYSLAMLALVLRIYGQIKAGDAIMRTSVEPMFKDWVLGADQLSKLLAACGLECMGISMAPAKITKALQDFSNDRHVVLVGMQPSATLPYKHWSVLEASNESDVQLVIFGDSDDTIHSDTPLSEVITGEYVVIAQQVESSDITAMREVMDI